LRRDRAALRAAQILLNDVRGRLRSPRGRVQQLRPGEGERGLDRGRLQDGEDRVVAEGGAFAGGADRDDGNLVTTEAVDARARELIEQAVQRHALPAVGDQFAVAVTVLG